MKEYCSLIFKRNYIKSYVGTHLKNIIFLFKCILSKIFRHVIGKTTRNGEELQTIVCTTRSHSTLNKGVIVF